MRRLKRINKLLFKIHNIEEIEKNREQLNVLNSRYIICIENQ